MKKIFNSVKRVAVGIATITYLIGWGIYRTITGQEVF